MTWVGMERYGYLEDAQRLAYRFLYMMTTAFVDFNGVVPEKVRIPSRRDERSVLTAAGSYSSTPSSSRIWSTRSMETRVSISRWFPVKVSVG